MTIQGHIQNGQVVLHGPMRLPDGTKVTVLVQPIEGETEATESYPTLYERLQTVAGKAKDLPADLAINHDHYLHGQPKRQ